MPIVHRRSPLSVAISAALFAVVATSAAASPQAASQDQDPSAQTTAQTAPASDQPQTDQSKAKKSKAAKTPEDQNATTLSVVNVVGVRASQMRAIQLKREAPNIQDSITAESIGQLPDVTITDALQRVTGVQINRDAGVGTSVDVRGLPEVGTMLNGEVFITPNQIDSQQPDFEMLPATLFRGVDVIKSPTASMLDTGISGDLNLHTYRPWDLPNGFTYSYSAHGERGDATDKWGAGGERPRFLQRRRTLGPVVVGGFFRHDHREFDGRPRPVRRGAERRKRAQRGQLLWIPLAMGRRIDSARHQAESGWQR